MGNGKHGAILKLALDNLLNQFIIFHIDIGSRFINNNNFAFLQEGSADTKQLLLSRR